VASEVIALEKRGVKDGRAVVAQLDDEPGPSRRQSIYEAGWENLRLQSVSQRKIRRARGPPYVDVARRVDRDRDSRVDFLTGEGVGE
jgi:hypothetical protein